MTTHGELIDENTVRFERLLPGPIEPVWQYLVESEKRAAWLCAGEFGREQGAAVELRFHNARLSSDDDSPPPAKYAKQNEEIAMSGEIVACEPPTLLEHTWVFDGENSHVRYELEAVRDQVRLTLTHSRLPDNEMVLSVSGGWHSHLALLEAVMNEDPLPPFWRTLTRAEAEYKSRYGF